MLRNWVKNRKLKQEQKETKWADPYNVENMSKEDFLANKKKLTIRSIRRATVGILFFICVILLWVVLWNVMFDLPKRWFF